MSRCVGLCISVFAVMTLAGGLLAISEPAGAQALMSEAAARAKLEKDWGVEVLRVQADEQDGVPVFLVRVMNPGGNFNEAFQVNVLVIDRRTGELVPQFRHGPTGLRGVAGAPNDADENSGPVLRRESIH